MEERTNQNRASAKLMTFDFADQKPQIAKIRVVGVGGAGGNAINRMIEDQLVGVDFIAINTDMQALDKNAAPCRLQIGRNLTRGLGAGGNPEIGRKAIEENKDTVIEALSETDMVFITCGMGGGTGTGAAPVVAEIARDYGSLTVAIVTTPFMFEGARRREKAEQGIKELKDCVDTLIVVPNQKLLSLVPKNTPLEQAFRKADEILLHATKGISDVINVPGLINLDFADVKAIMSNMGDAIMGSAIASGDVKAKEAAEQAITSPLIDDVSIMGALGVLVNITGGSGLSLDDINEATSVVYNAAGSDANIIFGAVIDQSMNGDVRVTVIATGFDRNGMRSSLYTDKQLKVPHSNSSSLSGEGSPFHKIEQEMVELFGNDGGLDVTSKDDLNIPTFIRKQMD